MKIEVLKKIIEMFIETNEDEGHTAQLQTIYDSILLIEKQIEKGARAIEMVDIYATAFSEIYVTDNMERVKECVNYVLQSLENMEQ